MKKPYIVGSVVIVILIILSVVGIYFEARPKEIENAQTAASANSPLTLTSIRPDVFAEINGDKNGTLVTSSSVLSQNDGVRTGASGRALLENSDFRTTVDHDSEVSVKEIKQKHADLALNNGSVWLRVQKVFGAGEGVEVETGNAVAAVRGTSFGLSFSDGITTLLVAEGTVGFRAIGSSTVEEKPVRAGEKGVIGKDGKVIITSLTTTDKSSDWYKFNNPAGSDNPGTFDQPSQPISTTTQTTALPPPQPASTSTQSNGNGSTPISYPRIKITSVSPATVIKQPATITVDGEGFDSATRLIIGDVRLPFEIISDRRLRFTLDEMDIGTYDLRISNPDSIATKNEAITVRSDQGQSNFNSVQ